MSTTSIRARATVNASNAEMAAPPPARIALIGIEPSAADWYPRMKHQIGRPAKTIPKKPLHMALLSVVPAIL